MSSSAANRKGRPTSCGSDGPTEVVEKPPTELSQCTTIVSASGSSPQNSTNAHEGNTDLSAAPLGKESQSAKEKLFNLTLEEVKELDMNTRHGIIQSTFLRANQNICRNRWLRSIYLDAASLKSGIRKTLIGLDVLPVMDGENLTYVAHAIGYRESESGGRPIPATNAIYSGAHGDDFDEAMHLLVVEASRAMTENWDREI